MKLHKTNRSLIVAAAFLCLLGGAANAYGGVVTGTVTAPGGVGVAGVSVDFYDAGTGVQLIVAGNITDALGNYGVVVPDGVYDVEFVTPVVPGGIVPVLKQGVIVLGPTVLNAASVLGVVLTVSVTDTLGLPVDAVDVDVADAVTGALDFTPNDNTNLLGEGSVIIEPGVKRVAFSHTVAGSRLAAVTIDNLVLTSDLFQNVSLPAGVFVTGHASVLGTGSPVQNTDLDADDAITGNRIPTPGDNTDNNGDYVLTVPIGVYNFTIEPRVNDGLVSQRIFSVPVNKDTIINWLLEPGFNLSGTVTGPGGAVLNCDIDVIDTLTLAKLVTPGDKTDNLGFYEVIVPSGDFEVHYQPLVSTGLASLIKPGVHVVMDTVVDAILQSGVLFDGTVKSGTNAPVSGIDIDVFETSTGANVPVKGDFTLSDGSYAMILLPNTYDLEFEPLKSRRLQAKRIPGVSINTALTLPVVLDTGISVSGTITSGGFPVDSVDIDAIVESSGLLSFQPGDLSNALGGYEVIIGFVPHTLVFYPPVSTGLAASMFTAINPGADQLLDVSLTAGLNLSGTITDPGGLPLAGVTLRAESGLTWVPTTNGASDALGAYESIVPAGTYTLKYIPPAGSGLAIHEVTGVNLVADAVIDVQFQGANQPPVLTPINGQAVDAGVNLNLTISAADPDLDNVQLSALNLPTNGTFVDHLNGTGTFDFNPDITQIGVFDVTFVASDGDLEDSEIVQVAVTDPNCTCPCHADPQCDDVLNVVDVVRATNIAFRNFPTSTDPGCPNEQTDVNCDGVTSVLDVVKFTNVAFRNFNPSTQFCNACAQ